MHNYSWKKVTFLLHFLQIFCIFWVSIGKFCDIFYINTTNMTYPGSFKIAAFEDIQHNVILVDYEIT